MRPGGNRSWLPCSAAGSHGRAKSCEASGLRDFHFVPKGPEGEFGPVLDLELPEDPVQILFDRAFRQSEFERDLLIQLGLRHEVHDLFLAESQIERLQFGPDAPLASGPGSAGCTDPEVLS